MSCSATVDRQTPAVLSLASSSRLFFLDRHLFGSLMDPRHSRICHIVDTRDASVRDCDGHLGILEHNTF